MSGMRTQVLCAGAALAFTVLVPPLNRFDLNAAVVSSAPAQQDQGRAIQRSLGVYLGQHYHGRLVVSGSIVCGSSAQCESERERGPTPEAISQRAGLRDELLAAAGARPANISPVLDCDPRKTERCQMLDADRSESVV